MNGLHNSYDSVLESISIMFAKQHDMAALADLSTDLCDESDWRVGILRTFSFPLNVSAVAVEPLAGLIAVGKVETNIHLSVVN
jgi:hypothetical protein